MPHEPFALKAPSDPGLQADYQEWLAATKKKSPKSPLTEEEKARPYAKYFRAPIDANPAHQALMKAPCDPAKALYPEQINDLLNPGYLEVETGWCVLANGAGFVADLNRHEGITAEMIEWWFAWHCLEDLRYRIWSPPHHAGVMLSRASRKQILDPNIPIREKIWGISHHVTEDVGGGVENIDIGFLSPQDFGFDLQRWKEPNVATFIGGFGWSCPVEKSQEEGAAPTIMCHFFRTIPGGIEQRSRFWMGYKIANGKPELCLPPGFTIPAPFVQGLSYHSMNEFNNLSTFLPQLYQEYGGKITA
jgi:hypothetical protein